MLPPDQRILGEKYRLVRQLDEGGMGSVWLAEHLSLHSPVAVKLITKEIADSEESVQRFMREARAAASLRSPHVVQILDYGVDEGSPYIIMELLEGESLARRLARVQRLNPQQTGMVFRHVARAVARAHDAGIVHRDLKPSNVFITSNEDEELVKLLDFGIAKAALDVLGASIASNTRTGAFLGTPYYVSPEQAEGAKSLDYRTDIWSLGVIAYECLIGRLPFFGETFGSLVLSICSRPMPVPSQSGPVPAGFDDWFARACARDVEQRFQSVREAASSLRQLLDPAVAEVAPHTQHSQGVPALSAAEQSSPPSLVAVAEADVPPSLPVPRLDSTTAAASSSATTRRRPARAHARVLAWSGLAALTSLAALIAVGVWGARGGPALPAPVSAAAALAPVAALPKETQPPIAAAAAVAEPSPRAEVIAAKLPAPGLPAPTMASTPGPNVAPLREPLPPALPSAAPEQARTLNATRVRTGAVPAGKTKPAPLVKVRPVAVPSPAGQVQQGKPEPTRVEPGTPAPAAKSPPAKSPAGKYGVNLGI